MRTSYSIPTIKCYSFIAITNRRWRMLTSYTQYLFFSIPVEKILETIKKSTHMLLTSWQCYFTPKKLEIKVKKNYRKYWLYHVAIYFYINPDYCEPLFNVRKRIHLPEENKKIWIRLKENAVCTIIQIFRKSISQHVNFYIIFINASCVIPYNFTQYFMKEIYIFAHRSFARWEFCYEFLFEMTTKTTTMSKR